MHEALAEIEGGTPVQPETDVDRHKLILEQNSKKVDVQRLAYEMEYERVCRQRHDDIARQMGIATIFIAVFGGLQFLAAIAYLAVQVLIRK